MSSAPAGAPISASLTNKVDTTRPEWVTDIDGEFIFRITNKDTQQVRVKISVGGVDNIVAFDLDDLVLESE